MSHAHTALLRPSVLLTLCLLGPALASGAQAITDEDDRDESLPHLGMDSSGLKDWADDVLLLAPRAGNNPLLRISVTGDGAVTPGAARAYVCVWDGPGCQEALATVGRATRGGRVILELTQDDLLDALEEAAPGADPMGVSFTLRLEDPAGRCAPEYFDDAITATDARRFRLAGADLGEDSPVDPTPLTVGLDCDP